MVHCIREDTSEVNLIGTYWWFHTSALFKAQQLPGKISHMSSVRHSHCLPWQMKLLPFIFLKMDLPQVMWPGSGAMPPSGKARMTITTNMALSLDLEWRPPVIMGMPGCARKMLKGLPNSNAKPGPGAGCSNRSKRISLLNDRLGALSADTFNVAKSVHMPSRKGIRLSRRCSSKCCSPPLCPD